MFIRDIEDAFTKKVKEYLDSGYILSLTTKRGSEGEITGVDLKNSDNVIRILLEKKYTDCHISSEVIELTVGRSSIPEEFSWDRYLWNNDFIITEKICFYRVGENRKGGYYGTKEEAEAAQAKRSKRDELSVGKVLFRRDMTESLQKAAYKILKKEDGLKRLQMNQIKRIECVSSEGRAKLVTAYCDRRGLESRITLYRSESGKR